MRLVIVESPFAGRAPRWARFFPPLAAAIAAVDRWLNVRYARAALRDCLLRGEAPIASHLLYTQPGVLRDQVPAERQHGIAAGLAWGVRADATVAYVDRGLSRGMWHGIERARLDGRCVVERSLPAWQPDPFRRATGITLAIVAALFLAGVVIL